MSRQLLETYDTKVVVWDVNGRVWHISGANAGREGVRLSKQSGYMFAPVQLLVSEGARQDGATFLRSVRSKKAWDFVAVISGGAKTGAVDPIPDFYAVHDAWFRGWSTDIPVTVGTFTRHQGWRFQRAQLEAAPEPIGDVDPARNAVVLYKMSAAAMDPLEHHFEETFVWTNTAGRDQGIVRARNAADQPAWPRYTMNGPGQWEIQDPVGGATPRPPVQTPRLGPGETLRIDTHPRHRTARLYTDDGSEPRNVWGQLAGRRWLAALPPWSSTDLTVKVDGGNARSSVIVSVTPRSSRPF
ncbi:phage tail protein [Nocardia sp. NPDC051570]|uniref:phage tail protein n=1 Tax=Nocardia sp. NPDC051570 TaxID=3364324 RepID=UPI003795C26F